MAHECLPHASYMFQNGKPNIYQTCKWALLNVTQETSRDNGEIHTDTSHSVVIRRALMLHSHHPHLLPTLSHGPRRKKKKKNLTPSQQMAAPCPLCLLASHTVSPPPVFVGLPVLDISFEQNQVCCDLLCPAPFTSQQASTCTGIFPEAQPKSENDSVSIR